MHLISSQKGVERTIIQRSQELMSIVNSEMPIFAGGEEEEEGGGGGGGATSRYALAYYY